MLYYHELCVWDDIYLLDLKTLEIKLHFSNFINGQIMFFDIVEIIFSLIIFKWEGSIFIYWQACLLLRS